MRAFGSDATQVTQLEEELAGGLPVLLDASGTAAGLETKAEEEDGGKLGENDAPKNKGGDAAVGNGADEAAKKTLFNAFFEPTPMELVDEFDWLDSYGFKFEPLPVKSAERILGEEANVGWLVKFKCFVAMHAFWPGKGETCPCCRGETVGKQEAAGSRPFHDVTNCGLALEADMRAPTLLV